MDPTPMRTKYGIGACAMDLSEELATHPVITFSVNMARVSRFTEEFDLTSFPPLERQTAMAEKAALMDIKSVAETKKTSSISPIKGFRRLATYYKRHFNQLVICNLRQISNHHDNENIEAGSMFSTYGARMASEAELKRQSERNHLDYIFYLGPDDESSICNSTAFKANKSTSAVTKAHATAEPRCPDAPTVWAQVYVITGYESEIERIKENTKATLEAFGIETDEE
ncbi:hypothetical protein TSTA_083530 [Talaromyces stipitatus ATCC 10500]|uniref:Uncharacterized protein n=1 Tax=Talaromyces stipitatus (strain ATCC 10500 / CBS 375.48 / QM 6759 / NRRL 1006) TaxID=441959 RepID=B8LZ77_TALSN|nr:uncharacterized protein TSTA_083530 [Talaromyces stipitatus ATCC 10500]EED21121.1 hypothetical protein TSTA_083530 [Talaromyces stipitatus ATCC 10500]